MMWKYFAHIYRDLRNRISARLRKYNIGSGQSEVLRFLFHAGDGKSQDEISRELELDNTTVTRAIQRLAKNGYVVKIKDEKDRRINRIYLTEKAEKVDSIAKDTKEKVFEILVDGVSDDELEIFMKVLKRMYVNMENTGEEIHFE